MERSRNHVLLVGIDGLGQGAVLVGLVALGIPVDHGLTTQFGTLHIIVARNEVDHLGAETGSQLFDQFLLVVAIAALQIRPPRRTPPASANFTIPLQILLAAYMAIISPDTTM